KDRGDAIKGLILLTDVDEEDEPCNFEKLQLLFADGNKILQLQYIKFYRFIKVWKKLGWTIDQTDRTFAALWPDLANVNDLNELNEGFRTFLYKLAHLLHIMELLRLKPKRELQQALALVADIDIHGHDALYRQLFLNSALSEQSDAFNYNPNGEVLTAKEVVTDHEEAILGALNITSEKLYLLLDRFVDELGGGVDEVSKVPLSLPILSDIYRYNLLARELKMSIEEVLILQDLAQIDPFASLTAVNPPIVRFIEMARHLKDQKVKLTSLTYYLRHEDLSGEASPTEEDILAFARQLTAELQRIETENSTGEDATADIASEKMALLYDPDTVNQFFSIINKEILFETGYDHHQEALEAEVTDADDRLTYNNFRKMISYTGIMTDAERDALKTAGDSITDAASVAAFKSAIDTLHSEANATGDAFFADNPNLQAPYNAFVTDGDYDKLIETILQTFKQGLKRQETVQLIADTHKTESDIVSALLEEDALDSEINNAEPAIADFLALEGNSLNVAITLTDNSTTDVQWETPEAGATGQELPADAKAVSLSFYVLVAESDYYNLRVETEAGANVNLLVDDESKAGTLTDTLWENDDSIYFEGNQYHRVELSVDAITTTVNLKWAAENGTGSYEIIPAASVYPTDVLDNFVSAYMRFVKALALTDMLDFTAEEISYFADTLQINGEGFLKSIPLSFSSSQANTHRQLFEKVTSMLYYNILKEDFDAEPIDMISIVADPDIMYTTAEGEDIHLLLRVADWEETEVEDLLARFSMAWADLSDPASLYRVHLAYQQIKETGLSAALLITHATNQPDMANVTSMENAIRLKYDNAGWLKIITPINDKLRNMQRDALVAYVLRLLSKNPKTQPVDTADKLFEYFLIDVQMDACMKTSRIKQALSSIQLFINRCLINLEANVSPESINKNQWVWMKRYRVWEANRKVFLYPENWLEPELRDNKSSFFKELEGELLQSEVNEDTVHLAMMHYLEKLDTVAKLEICSFYLDEKETGDEADDILHVIGRTAGAKRKYYYRRLEYGYWTPWEKVDAEIEDNPIVPVVWNGRLFLFWLMVIIQGEENNGAPPAGTKVDKVTVGSTSMLLNLEVSLCWSECFDGKWQPRNTSDFNDPMKFNGVSRNFKRSEYLPMHVSFGRDGELYVKVKEKYWKLFNKHSNPERLIPEEDEPFRDQIRTIENYASQVRLSYNTHSNLDSFGYNFIDKDSATLEEIQNGVLGLQHTLFNKFYKPKLITHTQPVTDLFESRFFVQNFRHVFYVVPEKYYKTVIDIPDYGWDPPVVIHPYPIDPVPLPQPTPVFPPIWHDTPVIVDIPIDRDPVFDVDTDPLTQPELLPGGFEFQEGFHTISNGLLSKSIVTFGNTVILPTGNADRILSAENAVKNLNNR
ncbi:MAG: neuraminidase-like domain-containing protein, partial [Cyclobacteriaceae bacterium]